MTQLILKSELDENRLDALLHFLKSWGVEAEVTPDRKPCIRTHANVQFSFGMWEDYSIDDRTLREKAWGTYKHLKK